VCFYLLRFKAEQRIYQIGSVKVGGQPGELPTVLVGNVFYKGMPEIAIHEKGEFDAKSVLKWINVAEELSEKTGVPHFFGRYGFLSQRDEKVYSIHSRTKQQCLSHRRCHA